MIEQIVNLIVSHPLYPFSPLIVGGTFIIVATLRLVWFVIDDQYQYDQPSLYRMFICWVLSLFTPLTSYQQWMVDYDLSRGEAETAVPFVGVFFPIICLPLLSYGFPLTILFALLYLIVIGLRQIRRTQKRVNNIPTEEE